MITFAAFFRTVFFFLPFLPFSAGLALAYASSAFGSFGDLSASLAPEAAVGDLSRGVLDPAAVFAFEPVAESYFDFDPTGDLSASDFCLDFDD